MWRTALQQKVRDSKARQTVHVHFLQLQDQPRPHTHEVARLPRGAHSLAEESSETMSKLPLSIGRGFVKAAVSSSLPRAC